MGGGSSPGHTEGTAVLAALSFWDYAFVADVPGSDAYKATGRCISVAAGRISYTYGFRGDSTSEQPCLYPRVSSAGNAALSSL